MNFVIRTAESWQKGSNWFRLCTHIYYKLESASRYCSKPKSWMAWLLPLRVQGKSSGLSSCVFWMSAMNIGRGRLNFWLSLCASGRTYYHQHKVAFYNSSSWKKQSTPPTSCSKTTAQLIKRLHTSLLQFAMSVAAWYKLVFFLAITVNIITVWAAYSYLLFNPVYRTSCWLVQQYVNLSESHEWLGLGKTSDKHHNCRFKHVKEEEIQHGKKASFHIASPFPTFNEPKSRTPVRSRTNFRTKPSAPYLCGMWIYGKTMKKKCNMFHLSSLPNWV